VGATEVKEMKCLNSRGCYGKDAVSLAFSHNGKYINTNNFCSIECYLIYSGERDPPKKEHQVFQDPERQVIHDIYIRYYGKEIKGPEKRGVKPGIKRGSYKRPKIARLEKRRKEQDRRRKHRERTKKYRERKRQSEIKHRQQIILEGV